MAVVADQFLVDSRNKVADLKHRDTIRFNMRKYHDAVDNGVKQYQDHELARQKASFIKHDAIANLDKHLLTWEENFLKKGGKVLWAENGKHALQLITGILKSIDARSVVKSKSMTTEEIHLNDYLSAQGIEPVETDLGEYIVQLAGQKPYHIVTPAMHMSRGDINELFVKKLNTAPTDDPTELTLIARRLLREKYTSADAGITGANFLIAETGSIAITENEGNARLSVAFPKVHIALVGIEKVIPNLNDLEVMWPILATHGTGQQVTVYNTIISGPRQSDESDGPEEMIVILMDNGRTTLLADEEKRSALKCIRCGACLNACPVYKNIGGHSYGSTYSGPIGSVITPHYDGMQNFKHLSFASSLCGACTSVCPVKIPLHELLLLNRRQSVEENLAPKLERIGFKAWQNAMKYRFTMNLGNGKLKTMAVNKLFKASWSNTRQITFAPKNFNQLWAERRGKKN